MDHAQFVVGGSGVEQIDRLYFGATSQRLGSSFVEPAQGPQGFGSVDAAVPGNTSDAGRFDRLHPFDSSFEIGYG